MPPLPEVPLEEGPPLSFPPFHLSQDLWQSGELHPEELQKLQREFPDAQIERESRICFVSRHGARAKWRSGPVYSCLAILIGSSMLMASIASMSSLTSSLAPWAAAEVYAQVSPPWRFVRLTNTSLS